MVRAPRDPAAFNGTVVMEWFNETSGRDADPDFGFAHPELLRSGFAYVGVSAQKLGVVGGGAGLAIPGYDPKPLLRQNPGRYASVKHPGDDYSYDIFSQAAAAVRRPDGPNPLAALHPLRIIAAGESQSAGRLVTYLNAVAPSADVFDGYLVHSRGAGGAPLSAGTDAPSVTRIRADLGRPVLVLETETDLFGLRFFQARQPDTAVIRTWEVAGTAHADKSTLDYGIASGREWAPREIPPDLSVCGTINNGPQRYAVRGALAALNRWVATGTAPPTAPRFVVSRGTAIARDANGNARGGIRTPAVDVPVSTLRGTFDTSRSVLCALFGSEKPFAAAKLHALYPTHAAYVAKVRTSADTAVHAGFLLPADRDLIVGEASAARVPS